MITSHRHSTNATHKGFTIVELLIVVVIIAILAAITVIAYNGLQARARASAASSAASQAKKKLELYKVDNSTYPATGSLAIAGITDSNDTTYQYTATNDNTNFCLTATTANVSYYINDTTASSPTAGGCPGRGQGGVGAITNLSANPSLELDLSAWSPGWGTGGAGVMSRSTSGGQSGSSFARMTFSTAPTSVSALWSVHSVYVAASAGAKTYTASGYVRPSWSGSSFYIDLVAFDASGAYLGETMSSSVALPNGAWTRLAKTYAAPALTARFSVRFYQATGTLPGIGATLDVDSVMLTEGSTLYNYADGSSPNWVWNGTANAATSTGPAQ